MGAGTFANEWPLTALVRNKWFTPTHEGGHMKIRLGERARKVREGKEDAKAAGGSMLAEMRRDEPEQSIRVGRERARPLTGC